MGTAWFMFAEIISFVTNNRMLNDVAVHEYCQCICDKRPGCLLLSMHVLFIRWPSSPKASDIFGYKQTPRDVIHTTGFITTSFMKYVVLPVHLSDIH